MQWLWSIEFGAKMMDITVSTQRGGARASAPLLAAVVYLLTLKLVFSVGAFPIADEAYYWMWGQHPSLSYFDHPPLNAWLLGLFDLLFGRSAIALRAPALLGFATVLWVLYLVARRTEGERWQVGFVRSAAVFLASPLFGFFASSVFPDYLLVAMLMVSGYFFFTFFADEERGEGRLLHLLAAATFLGLAALSKYNAMFLGLGVAAAVVVRPSLRHLLTGWKIYAAAAVTLAIISPMLIWNWQHDFASLGFHLNSRFGDGFRGIRLIGMWNFALETSLLLSPFLIPAIVAFFLSRSDDPFHRVAKTLAICTFWASTSVFLYIANYSWVLWWWNIAAFVLVVPFVQRYMGRFLLTAHIVWGTFINSVMMLSYVIAPATMLVGLPPIGEADAAFGWKQIRAAVVEVQARTGADFLAANSYQRASQLAFALDNPDVAAISKRRSAFDEWIVPAAREGSTAIVLVDAEHDAKWWKERFETVQLLETVRTSRFGLELKSYELYLAEGYAGDR